MTRRPEGAAEPIVKKAGLTYQMIDEAIGTTWTLSRVRRRTDSLTGYMTVRTSLDIKTLDGKGILLVGSLNLLGPKVREEFAKQLALKTPDFKVDWKEQIDFMAERVLAMEMAGEPIEEVGTEKVVKTAGAWAIKPLVPKGAPALFYGPGGSGKSRFALAAALSIQMGREILPGCPPAMKGNVLYLDWETDKDTVVERLQMICRGLKVDPVKISYRRCIRPLADDAEELSAYIAAKQVVFMVVDSASAAIGRQGEYGDANEGTLKLFEAIRVIGIAAMIVDHVSKAEMRMTGKVRGALPYGSIYRVNMARAAWEVRPVEMPTDDSTHVSSFHHTKANDSKLLSPFALRADFDEEQVTFGAFEGNLDEDEWTEPMKKVVAVDVPKRIEDLMRKSQPMSPGDIAGYLDVSSDTVRQALNRGAGKRFVKDEATGLWTTSAARLTSLPGGNA